MKKLCLFVSLVALISSCKKEITELPPATQTGANTFGAIVNGELWAPQDFGAVNIGTKLEARRNPTKDIIINARNFASSPTETEFELRIKAVTTEGTYPFNTNVTHPSTAASYAYFVKRKISPLNEWITSAQYTGTVTITRIDTVNRFVSGTFQFNALNLYNDPQPLTVTDGRFDVKWQ
ncbi:MAG TPA: DUF6252 family protein [Chitinophagaceae bacterium]